MAHASGVHFMPAWEGKFAVVAGYMAFAVGAGLPDASCMRHVLDDFLRSFAPALAAYVDSSFHRHGISTGPQNYDSML